MELSALIEAIEPLDQEYQERARRRLADLTKPLGSLGLLEPLVVRWAGIQQRVIPRIHSPHVLIFAADHGVVHHGVSRFGSEVTEEMAANIVMGGAVSSVLARQQGVPIDVVDVGMAHPARHPAIRVRKVRAGTDDFVNGPAMSPDECRQAFMVGWEEARRVIQQGSDCLVLGEMGIGNTTTTAALAAVLLGLDAADVVGPGTGLSPDQMVHKVSVVRQSLAQNSPQSDDPWDVMHKVGGLEIAALAGAIIGAAMGRTPVILDGVITTVAAVWAARLSPLVSLYCVASHRGHEPVHGALLKALGLMPLLEGQLRLGEASGGLLVLPLLRAMMAVMAETMTFADARVTNPHQSPTNDYSERARTVSHPPVAGDFSTAERQAVYKAISARRDIRSFLPDLIPRDTLRRILEAGHQGPSVGFMQPWHFIVIDGADVRASLQALAERERLRAARNYEDVRRDHYLRLKVEGFMDAPYAICVTNDSSRGGTVLGRNTIPETDLMSTACAIENMWLAARAEGVGLGWVSFYEKEDVRTLLGIPPTIDPVALLCLGYTAHFPERPLLERVGWETRRPFAQVVFHDGWGQEFAW